MKAIIDSTKCMHCEKCYAALECPLKAIFRIGNDEAPAVDMRICHGCGVCASHCLGKAVV
ncbi:MAG: 4Fe-4S dicluster domain-containing protein, partial [Crenarchaeota archaeon]|nr:4Fe-4S dicluster domain-containing protein [Thermoproteota archaeon]